MKSKMHIKKYFKVYTDQLKIVLDSLDVERINQSADLIEKTIKNLKRLLDAA